MPQPITVTLDAASAAFLRKAADDARVWAERARDGMPINAALVDHMRLSDLAATAAAATLALDAALAGAAQ